ncbi:MAG: hypothetical protein QM718_10260 [Steroidobacteraceae bacterium]
MNDGVFDEPLLVHEEQYRDYFHAFCGDTLCLQAITLMPGSMR